ncbi:endocuticle structural glycoprotein ABD-5-like isoform X2 [Armigeres subalbatus]|uniref:endocuticle structural glycoprotein ABD-5-like isoform X2 n=1 Tax=Armigeres subalbatus TaxID=124917 RepID=UPI002ED4132F
MGCQLIFMMALILAAANVVSPSDSSGATIVRKEFVRTEDGYTFEFETSDGQKRREEGKLVTDDAGNQYMKVQGSFSYTAPDGKIINAIYEADKDGYKLTPAVELPKPLGIPSSALLSLVG